jgi:hypothetical protein
LREGIKIKSKIKRKREKAEADRGLAALEILGNAVSAASFSNNEHP